MNLRRWRMGRLLGLTVALTLAPLGACTPSAEPVSVVLVNIQYSASTFEVDQVELLCYPLGDLADSETFELPDVPAAEPFGGAVNLLVLAPDRWAGRTIFIAVQGRRQGAPSGHGGTTVVPVLDHIEEATIVLTEGPSPCGNGVVDVGEQCDATELGGQSCSSVVGLLHGALACVDCLLDTTGCHTCGDGLVQPVEQCDGSELAGQSCTGLGFVSGALGCSATCELDLSACIQGCGNGVIESPEACDGSDLGGQSCVDLGYWRGQLRCGPGCALDLSGCSGTCGDGVLDPGEDCDAASFGDQSCNTAAGRLQGELACTDLCHLDVSDCHTCGDGAIEGPEACDGAQLGLQDCASVTGWSHGTLRCLGDCTLDIADCHECGDGALQGPEGCDDGNLDPGDGCDANCQVEAGFTCAGEPSICS